MVGIIGGGVVMKLWLGKLLLIGILCSAIPIMASNFTLPSEYPVSVGQWYFYMVKYGDTVNAIAKRNHITIYTLKRYNPFLKKSTRIKPGMLITIPNCYWVPQPVGPGQVVINLATQNLFYRPQSSDELWVYPVTVGKRGHDTPTGNFVIINKKEKPIWRPTAIIRSTYARKGIKLPRVVMPGPKNPLGDYAFYLNKPKYLIHASPKIKGLGGRQSFGCIRMFPHNIEEIYPLIPIKTRVTIIDTPIDNKRSHDRFCGRFWDPYTRR